MSLAGEHCHTADSDSRRHPSRSLQVVTAISQGSAVWDESQLSVEEGADRCVECPAFGPLYQGLDLLDASCLQQSFPTANSGPESPARQAKRRVVIPLPGQVQRYLAGWNVVNCDVSLAVERGERCSLGPQYKFAWTRDCALCEMIFVRFDRPPNPGSAEYGCMLDVRVRYVLLWGKGDWLGRIRPSISCEPVWLPLGTFRHGFPAMKGFGDKLGRGEV